MFGVMLARLGLLGDVGKVSHKRFVVTIAFAIFLAKKSRGLSGRIFGRRKGRESPCTPEDRFTVAVDLDAKKPALGGLD